MRKTGDTRYRAAVGVALAAVFLLVWLSLSVGIIGADGDPANLMYFGVIAVGIIGALAARCRPLGMAGALLAVALAQAFVAVIALVGRLGYSWSGPLARDCGTERILRRAVHRIGVAVSAGGAGAIPVGPCDSGLAELSNKRLTQICGPALGAR